MLVEGIRSASSAYAPAVVNSPAAAAESRPSLEPVRSAQMPYLSPVLQYDSDAAVAVLLWRDAGNGDIENQYPSKQVVREYQLRGRDVVQGTSAPSTGEQSETGGGNVLLGLARSSFATFGVGGSVVTTPTGSTASPSTGISSAVASSPTVAVVGGNVGAGSGSSGVNVLA